MSDDFELERLKARRLAEMQRNIQNQNTQNPNMASQNNSNVAHTPRDIVAGHLGFRGMEVLQNAELQFPNETAIVITKLAEIINAGEMQETLDGGKLLALFRLVGLHIRMNTKINVEQDGKFVSLAEKLQKESNNESMNQ